ncbi:signal peptidase I [Streptomyces sp. NPDC060064]|uniref:signal peptidase I n=1 Tax=Streptomyces sp. NPDC060064 TaxID=3347049 RepID=UPI00368625A6
MTLLSGRAAAGPPPQTNTARQWIRLLTLTSARVALVAAAGLLLWAHLPPLVLHWQSTLVVGGSMRPRLPPGDVVLYQPVHGRTLKRGQVVLFRDPARPSRLVVHRIHKVMTDGKIITHGDANHHTDSTPVPRSSLLGLARVCVPSIGLPLVWWRWHKYWLVIATALLIAVTTGLASLRLPPIARTPLPDPESPPQHPATLG